MAFHLVIHKETRALRRLWQEVEAEVLEFVLLTPAPFACSLFENRTMRNQHSVKKRNLEQGIMINESPKKEKGKITFS